jgi:hypothetical protein
MFRQACWRQGIFLRVPGAKKARLAQQPAMPDTSLQTKGMQARRNEAGREGHSPTIEE